MSCFYMNALRTAWRVARNAAVGCCSCGGILCAAIHEPLASQAAPTPPPDLTAAVAEFGNKYIARRPEAALVIGVYQNGRSFVQGFGHCSTTNSAAPDAQTFFEVGSITKVFTGVLLGRLAGEGAIRLTDPIRLYLPAGTTPPQRDGREITLVDLATHTSGLPRLPGNFNAVATDPQNPYAQYDQKTLFASVGSAKLSTRPGQTSLYSNYGFALLGQLLARKTGIPYDALLAEKVCQPLGLTNTVVALSPSLEARLAPGHSPQGKVVPNWDLAAFAPAGALKSDAADLLRFLEANLNPARTPLAAALTLAQQPHFKKNGSAIGLAWQIANNSGAQPIYWHNGGTGGYVSFMGFVPNAQAGIVLLSSYGDVWAGDRTLDEAGMRLLKLAARSAQ
ncbi:MAG TPA: serine hydrolase [Verrucomicrobiae bacterium]|nr:serine hydrolase [Verrucomicrobiae bacterium]